MSNTNNTTKSAGVGIPTILTLIFVVLKLVGVISWSWWWVLSPLWICLGAWIVVFLIATLVAFLFFGRK